MAESTDHFAAFSFVDRITEYAPGKSAHGIFHVPAAVRVFPACLVAEAVGQLAAWVSMEHIAYRGRPVAALAGETRFLGQVAPGDTLRLSVEIDDVDDNGSRVPRMGRGRRPSSDRIERLPGSHAARARLRCARGAAGAICVAARRGCSPRSIQRRRCSSDEGNRAHCGKVGAGKLYVPATAPFFADHFPRRPVFPATLLLDSQIVLATQVAREARTAREGTDPEPARMTHVKMRAFILPGQEVDSCAELMDTQDGTTRISLSARDGEGKTIATARVEFVTPAA